ncbi:hypothetical protein [Ruminococcus sp.]
MKSNSSIRNEIIEYIDIIESHKALVAILKFVKIIYSNIKGA